MEEHEEDSTTLLVVRLLIERGIDNTDRNRILTIVYLSVLACCCVTPFLYYLRALVEQNRLSRQNQDALVAALAAATTRPETTSATTSEAVRNERRALIAQLMEPVRMVLKEEHFVEGGPEGPYDNVLEQQHLPSPTAEEKSKDISSKGEETSSGLWIRPRKSKKSDATTKRISDDDDDEDDTATYRFEDTDEAEDSIWIKIPLPGLVNHVVDTGGDDDNGGGGGGTVLVTASARTEMRIVPGFCTICLSGFHVGSNIVWSSNRNCKHVFDLDCMAQCLMKNLHNGPICPCCRQDFIVDPYDVVAIDQARLTEEHHVQEDAAPRENDPNPESSSSSPILDIDYGDDGENNVDAISECDGTDASSQHSTSIPHINEGTV